MKPVFIFIANFVKNEKKLARKVLREYSFLKRINIP